MPWEWTDTAKHHSEFAAQHFGSEDVEYRAAGQAEFSEPFLAQVNRSPVNGLGNVLVNEIEVFLDKISVPKVTTHRDLIRLRKDKVLGVPLDAYQVQQILGEGDGFFRVLCRK